MALENVARSCSTQHQPETINRPTSFVLATRGSQESRACANLRSDELQFTFRNATATNAVFHVPAVELNEFIAFELSLVSEVKFVLTAFRDNRVFYVWIGVDPFEEAVRTRVYDRQRAIIDAFPMFDFDFYIVSATEQTASEFVSSSVHLAYKRK